VVLFRTVIEHVSVDAALSAGRLRAAAIAPASDSTYLRTRLGVILLATDIERVPESFFTTTGLIGTLHVDLEPCNLDGVFCHSFATGR
jgi:hypothetical protein